MAGTSVHLTEDKITQAINNAQQGIKQYLEIMRLFPRVNVALNEKFQEKYNAFYRVRQRKEQWYQVYYQYMESQKGIEVSFSQALRYFQKHLGRYEPSFSSKLVATHNPNMPIWDRNVLKIIGIEIPAYTSPLKFKKAETTYLEMQNWYRGFISSHEGIMIINKFNELISGAELITNTKKVDFVLWKYKPDDPPCQ